MDRNDNARLLWYITDNVALRKESVDRNILAAMMPANRLASLSARRAWIEIGPAYQSQAQTAVALRKESVDRNMRKSYGQSMSLGRSPQGERG